MTILVDASAIVAIINGEPEADAFSDAIEEHNDRCYCAVGAWEASLALARIRKTNVLAAKAAVASFALEAALRMIDIGEAEYRAAVEAHHRYGKGRHTAKLNMGDCFAYACAKIHEAKLLYKGDDFSHTDLA